VAAEAAAWALPGSGLEAADLEQGVWVRLLELGRPPGEPAAWVRAAVAAEALGAEVRRRCEGPYADQRGGRAPCTGGVEERAVRGDALRTGRDAVAALPGRCPELVTALLSAGDPTYREISRELGISQGSLGPLRSRCLSCLRTVLNSLVPEGCSPGGTG
jgi:DNA-directed RNA polymerase specialized sigma24 family protein